jgi:hypothetical protein
MSDAEETHQQGIIHQDDDLSGTNFSRADLTAATFDTAHPNDDTKWPHEIVPDGLLSN